MATAASHCGSACELRQADRPADLWVRGLAFPGDRSRDQGSLDLSHSASLMLQGLLHRALPAASRSDTFELRS